MPLLTAAVIAGVSAPATAAPVRPAAPSSVAMHLDGGPTVEAGWVSNAALARDPSLYQTLGIPTASPGGGVSAAGPATSGTNCAGVVCGKVYGTGLNITEVDTTAQGNVGCTRAYYVIVKGTDYETGPTLRSAAGTEVCAGGPGPGTYYYKFYTNVPDKLPYTCPSTSILGIFWDGLDGDPRFTIHA
ncbi:MAG: hypothetical protein M3Y42_13565 [Actinomycetota bacterium]|nr:hypothetical protein [Actinomycetota bacterium]MDQ2957982.1 hypothetical protein [Actinomycetota bacterium]